MAEINQYRLGEQDDIIHLESMQDNREVTNQMVQQATRSIHLFTQDLDPILYDTSTFIDAIKNVAIYDSHSFIKIIVKDSSKAVLHGHRLIELYRRLTSHIQIRKASQEFNEYTATYLLVDETGYTRRTHSDRYEGVACFNARDDCRHLLTFFDKVWEKSAPDPELRRLHI